MLSIWVTAINKRLEVNGGKYIAGKKITIADFALASIVFNIFLNDANSLYAEISHFINDYEALKNYANILKEDLGARLSTRPTPRPH